MDHNSQRDHAAPSNLDREKFDLYLLDTEAERNQFDAEFLKRISQSRWPASVDELVQHCVQRFELIAKQFAFLAFAGGPLDVDQHYGGPLEKSREATLEFFDKASRNIPAERRKDVRSGLALELASELQRQLASVKRARLSEAGTRAASDGEIPKENQPRVDPTIEKTAKGFPTPPTQIESPPNGALASPEIRNRRYAVLKAYRADHGLNMGDLARRFALSVSAIQGMARGDRSRYSEAKLLEFLKGIGVPPGTW